MNQSASYVFLRRILSVPVIGEDSLDPQSLLLDNQFLIGQFEDVVNPVQAHVIEQAFREPESIVETDLFLVLVERELGTIDIHVIEVQLGETALLGQGQARFAQYKEEIETGIIHFVPDFLAFGILGNGSLGIQGPYAVQVAGQVTGVFDTLFLTGREHSQASDSCHE